MEGLLPSLETLHANWPFNVTLWASGTTLWCRHVVAPCPPGFKALLLAVPILIANFLLQDMLPDRFLVQYAVSYQISWLANLKVLALCAGRGPLHSHRRASALAFGAYLTLAVVPLKQPEGDVKDGKSKPNLRSDSSIRRVVSVLVGQSTLLGFCAWAVGLPGLPEFLIKDTLYALGIYAFLGLLMDGPASIATLLTGVRFRKHFNAPWFSTSIGELWGYRWNLVAGSSLRDIVFDPIMERRLISNPSVAVSKKEDHFRRFMAVTFTFAASGLLHMLCVWRSGGYCAYKWFLFFILQAPVIALEKSIFREKRRSLPWIVKVIMTLLIFCILGHFFFISEAVEHGMADKTIEEITSVSNYFLGKKPPQ